ncbi:MAG TPA: NAD(P)H-dependent oxidoreductase subunit E [Actinomycetota bacterium]|nr:NAD(P)H-dependent oxidoreductase subunit E [Actinomycetota bacterium]
MAVFDERLRATAEGIVARYPQPRSALLPLLYMVQAKQGFVTREGMQEVGRLLGLTTAEVEAVATYYTMFKKHPTGRWVVSVCTNVSCALAGGRRLYDRAKEALGTGSTEVTEDGALTLEEVECLGACDAAPVVQVNYCNYDRVTEDRLLEMLDGLRNDHVPEPSRGPTPMPHDRTALLLAGLGDEDG